MVAVGGNFNIYRELHLWSKVERNKTETDTNPLPAYFLIKQLC
jgi:hypothetical protein